MNRLSKMLLCLCTLLLMGATGVYADKLEKYKAFADTIRQNVWGMDLPQFKNTDIPAKYKNESAVIVAAYRDVSVTQKSRLDLFSVINLNFKMKRNIICSDLNRVCIRINDQAALKKYSEFDFISYYRRYRYGWSEKVQHVLGVRVIKPDGTIREVGTDDYVNTAEGKNDKEKGQKLAVPGLAIGDNIDIFTYEEKKLEEHTMDPFFISYQDEYPMLWKKVHCVIDKDLTTQYRTLNGAPDFKQSTDEEKNIILDAEVTNVEKTDPDLWYNPMDHSPITVLNIQGKRLKGEFIPPSSKQKGLQANPSAKAIQDDAMEFYRVVTLDYVGHSELKKQCKAAIKQFPNITDRADYVYDLLCFAYAKDRITDASLRRFAYNLQLRLAQAGIKDTKIGYTTMDGVEPIDQLSVYANGIPFLYLKEGERYYSWCPSLNVAGELRCDMQGRKAILSPENKKEAKSDYPVFVLPASKAEDNQNVYTLNAKIENGTELDINHEHQATGTMREMLGTEILTLKDVYDSYLDRVTDAKPFVEALGKRKAEAEQQTMDKTMETQQERLKDLVKGYWDEAPKNIRDCKVVSVGTSKKNRSLAYTANYSMEGMVKKAGQNLILSTGKMLGGVLKMEGQQRHRTADIDMISPRQSIWNVEIALPEGYKVSADALEQLRKSVTNECGSFVSKASAENGKLLINVVRTYNHKHEPAANWDKLLQIIDATNAFTTIQTVIRK
jgi:hypothetical protein